ncbi:MAG: alpha/beta hydrolase [Chloroflexi bacterium]|nr:alpha/beta hydrolase [Chloroflexota bacterium]
MQVLIAILTIAALAIPLAHAQDNTGSTPTFEETDCFEDLPDFYRCGFVTVPELHAEPDGATIRLAVAIIPSFSDTPAADPFVMAQGGPGGSTIEVFSQFETAGELDFILFDRDIVLIEQRGTRFSEPYLFCHENRDFELGTLPDGLDNDMALQGQLDAALECHERLLAEGVNLDAFNSVENAADVPMVMDALGYSGQFNYYGVSYGAMLAQHLMRDHGDRLRSVIIDAVVPLDVNFIVEADINASMAMRQLFEVCAASADCNEAFPDLETVFFTLVDELNANPVSIELEIEGETYTYVMSGDHLVELFRQSLYSTELLPLLPQLIYEIDEGNYIWVEAVLPILLTSSTAEGMYRSVICAEDADFLPEEMITEDVYDSLIDDPTYFEQLCSFWDVPALGEYLDVPVESDIPTLIMSGIFDPITPAHFGDAVGDSLDTSYSFTFPNVGHGAIGSSECADDIISSFLSDPTEAPDGTCVEDLEMIFVTDLLFRTEPVTHEYNGILFELPGDFENYEEGRYLSNDYAVGVIVIEAASTKEVFTILSNISVSELLYEVDGWETYDIDVSGSVGWMTMRIFDESIAVIFAIFAENPDSLDDAAYEDFVVPLINSVRNAGG